MLITPNPDMMARKHAMRRSHHAQVKQVGLKKMSHCLDCGARWFNVEAAAEAAVNASLEEGK